MLRIRSALNKVKFDESIIAQAEIKATGMDIHTVKSCLESYGLFWNTAKMMVELKEKDPKRYSEIFTDKSTMNEIDKTKRAERGIRMFLAGVPLKEAWKQVRLW